MKHAGIRHFGASDPPDPVSFRARFGHRRSMSALPPVRNPKVESAFGQRAAARQGSEQPLGIGLLAALTRARRYPFVAVPGGRAGNV